MSDILEIVDIFSVDEEEPEFFTDTYNTNCNC